MRWPLFVIAAMHSVTVAARPMQNALHSVGPQAAHILDLWRITLALCTLVTIAILAACGYALWHAPRSDEKTAPDMAPLTKPEPKIQRNVVLAAGISAILLLALLVANIVTDRALAELPLKDAVHIELTGHEWWWEARYDAEQQSDMFNTANELHIPVGKPIIITLKSSDVIHSLWVPNLHGKKDLIPGRTATITFQADKPGLYRGQCAEFCGHEHALMSLLVFADTSERYEAWLQQQRQSAPEPATAAQIHGQQVFLSTSCVLCHTIQGTPANAATGPDLTHLASRQTIAAATLPNDADHLVSWIRDPQKSKPGVNMPANALTSADMRDLLAYLGTLK